MAFRELLYVLFLLAIGGVAGWFLREIVYNAVRDTIPKRKHRAKKLGNLPPDGVEPPEEPTPAPPPKIYE